MKKNIVKQFPFYVLILSIYPILTVYALNIKQINGDLIVRSLVISFFLSFILLIGLGLTIHNFRKAGLFTALIQILFFSYGHLYGVLEKLSIGSFRLGQHKILIPVYVILFGLGIWGIIKWKKNLTAVTLALDVFSLILLLFPVVTMITFSVSNHIVASQFKNGVSELPAWSDQSASGERDIYYIILDTYTRSDSLWKDFHFDNSKFENALRARGFYIAECSRPNYDYTLASLASSLNMTYLDGLDQVLVDMGMKDANIWTSIKHSKVRFLLEQLGYTTVAFDTGYDWSQITDADIYYPLNTASSAFTSLNPFETILIRTTALDPLVELSIKLGAQKTATSVSPFTYHINLEQFLLSQVVKAASLRSPKFVFLHILIPHVPYIFRADGSLNTDPAYFSRSDWHAADDTHEINGYVGQVEYINSRMLEVVDGILAASRETPIIIIQGDHGLRDDNRHTIFNAYLLPDGDPSKLYASISPVNTFRLIFNEYFGADLGLFPDYSFASDDTYTLVPETSDQCLTGNH
jgi:hypothetical protein